MMKKGSVIFKFFAVLSLTALQATQSWAAFSNKDKGTTSANFLKLGVGARAVALGEAYAAMADDATAIYWNPSALTKIERNSISFTHTLYLASSYFDYAAYGRSLGQNRGAFGFGIERVSAGAITETDATGKEIGSFNPSDLAVIVGYGRRAQGFYWGLNLKFIESKILDSANALALDAGVLSPSLANDRLQFAFTFSNLGTKIKFENEKESLPFVFRLGSAFKIAERWNSSFDLGFPIDNEPYLAFGSEYILPLGDNLKLAGRFGVNTRTLTDVAGFTGLSFGAGLQFKTFGFDYGFIPFGQLGLTHRLSIGFQF